MKKTEKESRMPESILNRELTNYTFANIICNPQKNNIGKMNVWGFECFEAFFLIVNIIDKKLTMRKFGKFITHELDWKVLFFLFSRAWKH